MDGFKINDSGERSEFATGAVRDAQGGKGRFDLLPPHAILRLAKHFEGGAVKYEDRNWEKGIPLNRFIDSAMRHIFGWLGGASDEDHLIAAAWNLLCTVETEHRCIEGSLPSTLLNLPRYEGGTCTKREYPDKATMLSLDKAIEETECYHMGEYISSIPIPCPADCTCPLVNGSGPCPLTEVEEGADGS